MVVIQRDDANVSTQFRQQQRQREKECHTSFYVQENDQQIDIKLDRLKLKEKS